MPGSAPSRGTFQNSILGLTRPEDDYYILIAG
jgi:hypothetical protein